MRKILVLAERAGDALDDATWELLGAARALAAGGEVIALLMGGSEALAAELQQGFDQVHHHSSDAFATPGGETWSAALAVAILQQKPAATLMAHSNVTIDMAPWLSAKTNAPLLSDCLTLEADGDAFQAVRTLYGGKLHGRFSATAGEHGVIATLRSGCFAAAERPADATGKLLTVYVESEDPPRRRHVSTVEPDPGDVDISQAAVLVGVGRGIEDEENLEVAQALVEALGAELACSRPVVDKGWLPKSRQVGTSGVTVKPRVYVAVGISGSFQHIGGIKGSPYIVAINKDAKAPIFGVADVGIVGDLFEVVPALEEKVREARG